MKLQMNAEEKEFYKKNPKMLFAMIDKLYLTKRVAKYMLPRKYRCDNCGRKFHSYVPHGQVSELTNRRNVTMGVRLSDCPFCGFADKHKWLLYVMENYTEIMRGGKCHVLHFAPEGVVAKRIKKNKEAVYISGDIEPGRADYVVDMTNIQFENETFDYVIASMVIEHIVDEKKALSELKRVIKPEGTIILTTPIAIDLAVTDEDVNITDPVERKRRYGQEDHVRLYGRDYAKRFEECGFEVQSYTPIDMFTMEEIKSRGIMPHMPVILLKKRVN